MILICDENLGIYVPEELNWKGYDARSFRSLGWLGKPDVIWLPLAGQMRDSLVLTRDREIVHKPAEQAAIINNNVGIVCLTSGEDPVGNIVRLVTANWARLEELHNNTPHPFARFLTPEGQFQSEFNGRGL